MRLATPIALGLLLTGRLAAQTPDTGSITGRVRDSAGAPIPNAQVFIVGSAVSAQTDSNGSYRLSGVPKGVVDLRAAFVGYRPVLFRSQRVDASSTTTHDFVLSASVVHSGCILTITSEPPLVPRDHLTTKWRIAADAPPFGRPYSF